MAFSGTEVDLKDVQVDAAAVPNCGWCKVPSLHSGFATAMKDYLRRGGENQVKTLITNKRCKDGIIAVGHTLWVVQRQLCANSRNGWLNYK